MARAPRRPDSPFHRQPPPPMTVILLLIPVSLLFAGAFLGAFFWAVRSGQFEDTRTPSLRPLFEEPSKPGVPPPCDREPGAVPVAGRPLFFPSDH